MKNVQGAFSDQFSFKDLKKDDPQPVLVGLSSEDH